MPEFARSELLHRAADGREVRRLHVSPTLSYIRKPLPFGSPAVAVHTHILCALPAIYPQLIDWLPAPDERTDGWMLLEDLGRLEHAYREADARETVRLAAGWHTVDLPDQVLRSPVFQGHKPGFARLAGDVLGARNELAALAPGLGIAADLVRRTCAALHTHTLSAELVLSHGDLHVGNYARTASGRIWVLDWDFAHANSRYWDLYHILDLSHPSHPRPANPHWRSRLLDAYLSEAALYGVSLEPERFKFEYALFASVFSLWMLRLIAADRASGSGYWTDAQLAVQAAETAQSFRETAARL